MPSKVCIFSEECGRCIIIEKIGELFSCDHFVYPEHRLGNIETEDFNVLADRDKLRKFDALKKLNISKMCKKCIYRPACNCGCYKNRILKTKDVNRIIYLCSDYKDFFSHIDKYMKVMLKLYENGIPVSQIMDITNKSVWISK